MKTWKLLKSMVSLGMSAVLVFSSAAAYARTEQAAEDGIAVTAEADKDGFVIDEAEVLTKYTGTATEVVIPDGVIAIGKDAFSNCSNIKKVTIPASVISILDAFGGCSSLTDINVSSENSVYASIDGCVYTKDKTEIRICPEGKTKVEIPEGVTSIGEDAFSYCGNLEKVSIPDSVTSIGDSAFYYCSSLEKVSIPDSVTSIGSFAFSYCKSLTKAAIPTSVTSIKSRLFYGCSNLTTMAIPASVTDIAYDAFDGCYFLTIYGTAGSYAEKYAEKYDWPFVVLFTGDFDIDMGQTDFIFKKGSSEGVAIKCSGEKKDFVSVSVNGERINEKDYTLEEEEDSTIIKFSLEFMDALEEGDYTFTLEYEENRKVEMIMTITGPAAEGFVIEDGVLVKYDPKKRQPEEIEIPDTVVSIGERVFADKSYLKKIIIPGSVKSIGSSAFVGCNGLTEVTIPGSVESIGDSAFSSCGKLTKVTMLDGVKSIGDSAFYYCRELAEVELPESLTSIGNSAFGGCTGLTEVEIPGNVTKIGNLDELIETGDVTVVLSCAFSDCSNLTSINVSPENETYASEDGCVYTKDKKRLLLCPQGKSAVDIPEGVTSIEEYAFYNCQNLTEVTIPESVKSINNGAFSSCSSLEEVTIPGSVENIGFQAFSGCSSLTKVTMLEGVTSIGARAFSGCRVLEEIKIPESVTSIGDSAFSGTKWMENQRKEGPFVIVNHILIDGHGYSEEVLVIPDDITSIGESAFANSKELKEVTIPGNVKSIGQQAFESCANLTKVTMQDGVESIGTYAFMFCRSLNDVTFPKSIISIGASAFHGTKWLENKWAEKKLVIINHVLMDGRSVDGEVVIPDVVTTISDFAFYSTGYAGEEDSLTGVTIPRSVTSIGEYAFNDCKYLKKVTILGSETKLGRGVFLGCPDVTIYGGAGTSAEEYAKEYDIQFVPIPVIQEAQTDVVYVKGSTEGATIKCTGDLKDFKGVSVDGNPIEESCYTLEEGSTIINFTQAFMDTLKNGEHIFTLEYEGDWKVEMTMTVTASVIGGIIGDVNGDGKVNSEDALNILKCEVGLIKLDDDIKKVADVNADGKINSEDALDVLKREVGLIDKFKAEAGA